LLLLPKRGILGVPKIFWRRRLYEVSKTDLSSLRPWVQEHHLDEPSLQTYRERFESNRARLLHLEDFLAPSVADRLGAFLENEGQFESQFGLYSEPDRAATETEWLSSDESDHLFRFSKLTGTAPDFQLSHNALTYIRFRKALSDPSFVSFFERVSGLQLESQDDFGSHSMGRGDFLLPHDDNSRGRSLAIVDYLSPEWDPRFGGGLRVDDEGGETTTIDATFNSIVMFDVAAKTTHAVEPITNAAGERRRLTIGGWYH
jgi:hypothetical protein